MNLPTTVGITGGAGFVGANLTERLLREGCRVIAVDDMSAASMRNVADFIDNPAYELHKFDCRDVRQLRKTFADVDAIVALAAKKIPRYGGAVGTLEVNTESAHAAYEVGIMLDAHVVFASTSDVYGNAAPPFNEADPIVLGPSTTRRWAYAISKLYDEHMAFGLAEDRGLRCTILRLFNSYGPRAHPTWWAGPTSPFIENLLDGGMMELHGDGRQVRTFTYVGDTVDGFVRALARPETAGEIINIGGDEPVSIFKLAQKTQAALDIAGPLRATMKPIERIGGRYQDVRIRIPDVEKAAELLGFRASVPLEEGLAHTVAWHRLLRAERDAEAVEVA